MAAFIRLRLSRDIVVALLCVESELAKLDTDFLLVSVRSPARVQALIKRYIDVGGRGRCTGSGVSVFCPLLHLWVTPHIPDGASPSTRCKISEHRESDNIIFPFQHCRKAFEHHFNPSN